MNMPSYQPGLPSILQGRFHSRSMGMKLIFVCALALLMTIPTFFVSSLVEERTQNASTAAGVTTARVGGHSTLVGISSLQLADSYRSVSRALKYTQLFVGLVFLSYFMFEVTSGRRVHPAQYVLVGIAQVIFYLLLLSVAEQFGFDLAYVLAGVATVGLLSTNAAWIFKSHLQGFRALATFSLLYSLIYVLLRLEYYTLLIGAIASFFAVAAAMYLTRNIDWYSSIPTPGGQTPQPSASIPGDTDFHIRD